MREFLFVKRLEKLNEALKQYPVRSTEGSAGYDIFIPYSTSGKLLTYDIQPGQVTQIMLGIKALMNIDEVLLVYIRSSLGRNGLVITNGTSVVDSDYFENSTNDGEISVFLKNTTDNPISLKSGDRICQGIFTKYLKTTSDLHGCKRKGGYGSTGK